MKLYHSTASPNSRRVRMFMAEKGISIPLQPVNLAEKEQFSDGFKAINPRQQVPALVLDDGTAIAEVPAIWRLLEERHPERPLLGSDATGKALVIMWERRAELDGFAPTMEGVRNAVPGLKGRDGLFKLIRSAPDTLRYEHQLIVAEGDYVIVHGRFSGNGRPAAWIAADVVRIEDGRLAEHWDVLQDEATEAESKSGRPMFGIRFPA